MQLAVAAPVQSLAQAAWTPVQVQLDVAVRPEPSVPEIVVTTFRIPTAPSGSVAQAQALVKVWRGSTVVDDQRHAGVTHPRERALAAAVLDALRGSRFLSDAKVVTKTEALPVGMARVTTTDADGTRRAFTFAMDSSPAGYERFDDAANAYLEAVFPG